MAHYPELPPLAYLREAFFYDASQGKLFWKCRPVSHFTNRHHLSAELICRRWNTRHSGNEAGVAAVAFRSRVAAYGKIYPLSRIIWKMDTGSDPINEIDHIDGDFRNNNISNLRDVTPTENMCNRRTQSNNETTKSKNICFDKSRGRYIVSVSMGKKVRFRDRFDTFNDAVRARDAALKEIHGEFARMP